MALFKSVPCRAYLFKMASSAPSRDGIPLLRFRSPETSAAVLGLQLPSSLREGEREASSPRGKCTPLVFSSWNMSEEVARIFQCTPPGQRDQVVSGKIVCGFETPAFWCLALAATDVRPP